MSKGYFLEKWFRISDKFHAEMNGIFKKNNVPHLSLNQLPDADRERWYELKRKCDRITDNVTALILNK